MTAIKCGNCGANIPDKAAFCPGCGTQKATQPVAQMPVQTMSKPVRQSNPFENLFGTIFSKTIIIGGTAIAILLAWIGLIISMYSSSNFREAVLISSLGYAVLGLLLIGGGIWNHRINQFVRLAMVFIGVYLIIQTLSVVGLFSSMATTFSGMFR